MPKLFDLTGKRFGKWTVIKRSGINSSGTAMWLCECDCGTIRAVRGTILRNGMSESCGCIRTHGLSNTRLHRIWSNMKQRCYNKNNDRYNSYGGRGIKVCDEWMHDFMSFYNWSMVHGYKNNLTIDRIDVNKNYEPNNCRWLTNKKQQFNKRGNHLITYKGTTQTITEWSTQLGIKKGTLLARIDKYKWPIEKAFIAPIMTNYRKVYQYTLKNELIKTWDSVKQCRKGNFNSTHIKECCQGKRKTHKGYRWSYELILNKAL